MIKTSRIEITGIANALYGMRLPLRSHNRADTLCEVYDNATKSVQKVHVNNLKSGDKIIKTIIGDNDRDLAKRLILSGDTHAKWMRQIQISMLISGSMTFFWDLDTYKVATTKNSSSRMHKIHSRELTPYDFAWDDLNGELKLTPFRQGALDHLNDLIERFNSLKITDEKTMLEKKEIYRELINDLPDGFMFDAMYTMSAQTARHIYFDRKDHKQLELKQFARSLANLPDIGEFITLTQEK